MYFCPYIVFHLFREYIFVIRYQITVYSWDLLYLLSSLSLHHVVFKLRAVPIEWLPLGGHHLVNGC